MAPKRGRPRKIKRGSLPPFPIQCKGCGQPFTTRAKGGQSVKCPDPECRRAAHVPTYRPGMPIEPLPEPSPGAARKRPRTPADVAPETDEQWRREENKRIREELREAGWPEAEIQAAIKAKRRGERAAAKAAEGPTYTELGNQLLDMLGIPAEAKAYAAQTRQTPAPRARGQHPAAPPKRPTPGWTQPRPTPGRAQPHPTIDACGAEGCPRPTEAIVTATDSRGKRTRRVAACPIHKGAALAQLAGPGLTVRAAPVRPTPPARPCQAQGCQGRADSLVTQTHGAGGGATGHELAVCITHLDDATAHLTHDGLTANVSTIAAHTPLIRA